MNTSLSLNANDVGLIYSYLFVNNADKYNTILYEIDIETTDNITTIKIVFIACLVIFREKVHKE